MSDLGTMLWKEVTELFSNRRSLSVFVIAVLFMGVLPALTFSLHHGALLNSPLGAMIRLIYVLFATTIVVSQTAADMILHERVGHTLEYLLTTRVPEQAIFGAKVLLSFAIGYAAALAAMAIQLITTAIAGGAGFQWLFLGPGAGQVAAFGATACLSLYAAVIGTFVALRVGDQRAAYMVTVFAVAILAIPFLVGWVHFTLTVTWMSWATAAFGALAVLLALIGMFAFRRDMLVLYLQE